MRLVGWVRRHDEAAREARGEPPEVDELDRQAALEAALQYKAQVSRGG